MKKFIGLAGLVLAGMIPVGAQAKPCRDDGQFCWYRDGDRVEYINRLSLKVKTGDILEDIKTGHLFKIRDMIAPDQIMPLCENEKTAGIKSAYHLRDLLMADPNNHILKVTYLSDSVSIKASWVRIENRYGSVATQMIMDNQAIEEIKGLSPKKARQINWCGGSD